MNLDKYKLTIIIPLALWVFFKLVALVFGFSAYPDLSVEMLLDDTAPFLPMLFGLWIGAASYNQGLFVAMRNAFVVILFAGGTAMVILLYLINNSPNFVTYAASVYSIQITSSAPFLNLGISKWIISMFVTITAAGVAYILLSKIKGK